MGRLFGLVLMLVALTVAMTLYTEGIERAFGGAFAPIESADGRDAPHATHLTAGAQMADTVPTDRERRVRITDAVRDRVSSDLQDGARRRGY